MKTEHRQNALISTTFSTYLGNVRSVIGDTKWNEGGGVFSPAIISYTNYYPFGMAQVGRNWSSGDIDLSAMSKGYYVVILEGNTGTLSRNIIVE